MRALFSAQLLVVVVQSLGDYWHSYRARFPDGFEAMFRRQELAVFSQYK